MPKRRLPKFFTSLFFKLMVIILVAGLSINLSVIVFFGAFRHHIAGNYQPLLTRYIDYILKDLGDPPDQARAREFAEQTGMIIAFDEGGQSWTTAEEDFRIPRDRLRVWHRNARVTVGRYRGAQLIEVMQGQGVLTFYLPNQPDAENKIKLISLCLVMFISVLLVGAYLAIRWVLKPLHWLKDGVDHVAKGDLSHRVPLRRSDELRDLSASFNTMIGRLQQLIASKEQLLLDVSHELRSPITRMKVTLAMMPESDHRQNIEDDLMEMEKKISELLETARALNVNESLNCVPTDLAALIAKTAKPFEAGLPPVRIEPMPDLGLVSLDEARLAKALKNIIENAQKYSPDHSQPIQIALIQTRQQIVITIQDHGIGIPKQDLAFVFEPFYRVDKARSPQRDGYGLGLSLAKTIVEAHGGYIHIDSAVDSGTLVSIHLPRNGGPSRCV